MKINPDESPNWNMCKSKHDMVSVYNKILCARGEETIQKIFRGSEPAFVIWRLSHRIPETADVIVEC